MCQRHAGADPGFLRGGGQFEIMRAKYWYVIVTPAVEKRLGGGVEKNPHHPLLHAGPAERFSAGGQGGE